MKITICGSIAFFEEMKKIKERLEKLGHTVKMPPHKVKDNNGNLILVTDYYKLRKTITEDNSWVWDRKQEVMKKHLNKVLWADAILVLNYDKNNIKSYIGGNTFLEMAIAFNSDRKIYLINPIPEISFKEEILGIKPIIINNDLKLIA